MDILKVGAAPRDRLDGIEARITEIATELKRTETAQWPLDQVLDEIKRELQGEPAYRRVRPALSRLSGVGSVSARTRADALAALTEPLTLTDLAALNGADEVLKKLRLCLAPSFANSGLPTDARKKRLAELGLQLRSLEIEAERETMDLEKRGYIVLRRAEADVALLFEVWGCEGAGHSAATTATSYGPPPPVNGGVKPVPTRSGSTVDSA